MEQDDSPCNCSQKFSIEYLSEGRYRLGDKILFIRVRIPESLTLYKTTLISCNAMNIVTFAALYKKRYRHFLSFLLIYTVGLPLVFCAWMCLI